jgi:glycosyltransferase involved in cell wall biosynthesis
VLAKLLLRSRVVYDSHELWADRNGRPEWRAGLVATEWLFVRVADVVITASPGYAAALAARYRIAPPTVVRNIPERAAATPGFPPGDASVCVYVGGLMPGRGLEPAIDALVLAPGVRLRLVGGGHAAYVDGLVARARANGALDRVEFPGEVPPEAVVATAARAGFGLCLIEPICRSYELTLPNKLFEYTEAGLPILGSDLPVIAQTVAESGLGLVVDPADPAAIAVAMTALAAEPPGGPRRVDVAAFAARTTWAEERGVLAAVYRRATG